MTDLQLAPESTPEVLRPHIWNYYFGNTRRKCENCLITQTWKKESWIFMHGTGHKMLDWDWSPEVSIWCSGKKRSGIVFSLTGR